MRASVCVCWGRGRAGWPEKDNFKEARSKQKMNKYTENRLDMITRSDTEEVISISGGGM